MKGGQSFEDGSEMEWEWKLDEEEWELGGGGGGEIRRFRLGHAVAQAERSAKEKRGREEWKISLSSGIRYSTFNVLYFVNPNC